MNKKLAMLTIYLLVAFFEPAYAGLKTYNELPDGKSGQWYACFDEQGYLDGYRTIKDYMLVKNGFLAFQRVQGNKKMLSTVYSAKGLTTNWDPNNLPKWIDNVKDRFINDKLVKKEVYKCRRVESYKGYLDVD